MYRFVTLIVLSVLLTITSGNPNQDQVLAQTGNLQVAKAALGTAYNYQGRLVENGEPANGSYDLRFNLYDAVSSGSQVGNTVLKGDIAVSEGYFTVLIDFGAVFDGQALWLEVSVRPGGSTGEYTILSPRQPLTATPYAAYSLTAPWSGLDGVPVGFADGVDNNTTYSAGDGLTLSGGTFSILFAGSGSATTAARSDHNHLGQTWQGNNNALEISGSFDMEADPAALVLSNLTGHGLLVDSTGSNGVYVNSAGNNGVYVSAADGSGVSVDSATFYGLSIGSAGWAGVLVDSTAGDGIHVNSADGSGVAVVTAGEHGVWAQSENSDAEGGHFQNVAIGGTGLFALGGDDSGPDLMLGANDVDNDDGRIYTDMDYTSSDMLLVSNDVIRLDLDNNNSDPNSHLWVLNGNNTTVFAIDEDGDMVAIGTKSAAVLTQDYGSRKLYAMESPQNWFEDFGSSRLVSGTVSVAIEPVFAQTVNLSVDYYVFLTPLGDCPLYVAEKTAEDFMVKAMGGLDCSIAFDYRIIAMRLGYEGLRLEPATDLESEGEDTP